MNSKSDIEKMKNLIKELKEESNSLSYEWSELRTRLDRKKIRENRKKLREVYEKIKKINYNIGKTLEENAKILKNPEKKLVSLLEAFKYFKKSSYDESLRILGISKEISISINNNKIRKFCEAQILFIECEILDDKAEEIWYECLNLGEQGEIEP